MQKILIGIGLVVGLFVIGGLVLPADYRVERQVTIAAPAAQVHSWLDDLTKWPDWAPWHDDDPSLQTTLGEQTQGVGASQSWKADGGDGWLKLTRSDPKTGIAYDMAFVDGETEMPAVAEMNIVESEGSTQVTWVMTGEMDMPVIGGYFAMLADSMIGGMFQRGLDNLKAKVEG